MFAAHRDVFRALFSMAQLDADAVGGAIARIEENRAGGMAHLAQRLAERTRFCGRRSPSTRPRSLCR
ncbi:hypothetical protein [Rhodococcus jostii]|jgi:hypothetical protein|uniref:hypothetical protein n=1 Tax=Rhodococcus jostii TaxID=132919 RepID=UPI0002EC3460|nr:hypothetical protein [Rhodococcus jostii]